MPFMFMIIVLFMIFVSLWSLVHWSLVHWFIAFSFRLSAFSFLPFTFHLSPLFHLWRFARQKPAHARFYPINIKPCGPRPKARNTFSVAPRSTRPSCNRAVRYSLSGLRVDTKYPQPPAT